MSHLVAIAETIQIYSELELRKFWQVPVPDVPRNFQSHL